METVEPLRKAMSREEMITAAKTWVRVELSECSKEYRMARLGCLIDFVTDLFDKPNVYSDEEVRGLTKTHLVQ
jgi:hypothetical protein